ncbi:MAG: formylglycine-generating enzyme family protein [Symploca sp. SIO2E6]|nr:formylglycine-generating enzyme family protein [Symploca sp. SIO2E6]
MVLQQPGYQTIEYYPQAKWAVSDLNPDSSNFKADNLPVEQVLWYDTREFCARLSTKTGRTYRLPSEAEWEYACRAGTTTPFHFGETITTDFANYNGNYTYGSGLAGEYRQKTTMAGNFQVANAFGLYDMHGNVWEWCEDHWHDYYNGAPKDGSAWLEDNDNDFRLLRGGSWYVNPRNCRSSSRFHPVPDHSVNFFSFRVAIS